MIETGTIKMVDNERRDKGERKPGDKRKTTVDRMKEWEKGRNF